MFYTSFITWQRALYYISVKCKLFNKIIINTMFSIFNIKKPSSSVPNVSTTVDDLSQSKGLVKDIDDPGLSVLDVSSDVNDLDLGDLDSGPRRPILKVCILLTFYSVLALYCELYFNTTCKLFSSLNLDD